MACNARRTGGGILEGSGGVRNILAGDVSLGKEESADDSPGDLHPGGLNGGAAASEKSPIHPAGVLQIHQFPLLAVKIIPILIIFRRHAHHFFEYPGEVILVFISQP